jgi:hypothetical protein
MTIEATLERIAIALEALAKTPQSPFAPQPQPQVPAYTMPQAPAAPAPVPMPTAPVIPLPTAQAAPVPVPQYVPPQPATPAPMPGNGHAAPFSTPAEFTNYCMQKYRDLGPVKGRCCRPSSTNSDILASMPSGPISMPSSTPKWRPCNEPCPPRAVCALQVGTLPRQRRRL